MKTISVKQVATALNLTPRAVIYRLEKGQLKGTQTPNAFGKQEWRVYPTREIVDGLKRTEAGDAGVEQDTGLNFAPESVEIVDADTVRGEDDEQEDDTGSGDEVPASWQERARDTIKGLADELVRPLTETICAQQAQLAEKDRIIQEKDQQLKLLPDLQKRAEEERQAAELRTLETEALRKQISALQERIGESVAPEVEKQLRQEKEAKESELNAVRLELERERKVKEDEIKALEEKLASVDEFKKVAEEAQVKLNELQKTVDERNRALEAEKQEKDSQTAAIREELAALSKELKKPWWKKVWSWGTGSEDVVAGQASRSDP